GGTYRRTMPVLTAGHGRSYREPPWSLISTFVRCESAASRSGFSSEVTMKSKAARKREAGMPSRRQVIQGGLAVAGMAVANPLLQACKKSGTSGAGGTKLKIGFVSPRTGATAGFGEPDGYVLELARKALAPGLSIDGKTYEIQ